MASEVFVDTSGFYSCLVAKDDKHARARRILRESSLDRVRFTTTDYVLDETATLLKMRGCAHLAGRLFEIIAGSKACKVIWMDANYFDRVREFFIKHNDHEYSFTDCFSFCVMSDFDLFEALTKDMHFEEAGFNPLLV